MPHHNINTMQVLWDNTLLILSGVLAWALALVGVDMPTLGSIFTGSGWEVVDYILNHSAIFLSCLVSLATLFKIKKELKKR